MIKIWQGGRGVQFILQCTVVYEKGLSCFHLIDFQYQM